VLLANTAEGGTNTTVPTNGNSGGASGNAWDTVTGSPTYSTTQAAHGSLSYSFSTTTAATESLNWLASIGSIAVAAGRAYLYATSFTVGSMIARGRDNVAAQVFRIVTDTTGKITLRVGGTNTLVGTGANSMSVNTWYRVEWVINVGAVAQVDVRVYLGDSTTLFDSVTSASANTGTNNVAEMNIGIFTSTASVPQYYLDDIVASDGSFPGPAVVSVTDSAGSIRPLTAADSVTAAVAVTDTAGVVRMLSPLDTVTAAVTVSDGAGILRGLRSLDTVVGGSGGSGAFSGTDSAGTLRLLSAEDCWRAATDVARPNTGLVTRPNAGLVGRPDSGLVCRP
jgi:hypothetical protein